MNNAKSIGFKILFLFLILGQCGFAQSNGGSCGGEGCHDKPPKPKTDPTPDPNPTDSTNIRSDAPVDPNEIIGPDGWMAIAEGDTVRWVSASESLPYTIYFENDPEQATAAAQVVTVRLKLHPLMNMADFGIGTFGFGNHVFPVEGAPLQYQTRLDLTTEMNLYVDVVAGIDITTNEAFWIFSSIDPATGVAPTETDRGFLAVNDSTHVGEGYVTFSIKPKTDLCHTGDTIGAQASIVFDINDPIMTNTWVNTIDAVAPTSSMTVVHETADSIYVAFNGNDDATGMAAYRLYYTAGQSAYRLAGRYPAGDTAVIATEPNIRYTFFSLGEDNVGNIEPTKDGPDTLFGNTNVQLLATVTPINAATIIGAGTYNQGDTATLTLHPATGYRLTRWVEAGVPQGTDTLLTLVADANHSLVAEMERLSYPLTVEAAEGTTIEVTSASTSVYQTVQHFDTLNIHLATSPCYSNVAYTLNGQPLIQDTTLVVTEAINLTSSSTTHIDTGYVHDTICPGYSYNSNGFNILSTATLNPGSFTFHVSSSSLQGCDSVTQLSLYVKNSHSITFLANGGNGTMPNQHVCDGEETILNNATFTRDGYYLAGWATTADATTAQYADGGIITLNANQTLYAVWSSSCVDREANRMVTMCDNYSWRGQQYTASGDYRDTITDVVPGGCDSIYILHLTMKQSTYNAMEIVACQPYTWIDGQTYTTDTNRMLSLTNSVGCDSIITLHLTMRDAIQIAETHVVCDSMTWRNGITYYQSTDTPMLTALGEYGCDSVTTLHLTVNNSSTGDTMAVACDSFTWWQTEITESTEMLTHSYTNSAGCDSTVMLHLTVNYSNSTIETVTACNSFVWHGTEYTTSTNTPTYTTENAAGCDSVTTLYLTVNQCSTTEITACDSYTWHGSTHTVSGTYFDGTDTLLLTINYTNTATETVTACDSYTWHGTTYTTSNNTATYTTTNIVGCDSVTTLNLTVNYSNANDTTVVACDSFSWWNTNYTNSTNEATHTLTNAAGCDSVVTLNLTVNYSNTGIDQQTACDDFTWIDGNSYTASTSSPTITSTNNAGCDSVTTLNLTINYSNTGVETVTACNGYVWHNEEYTSSTNTPTFTSTNIAGCDSVTTLHLTIENCSTTEITACDSYAWHGTTYTTSGMYFDGTDTLVLTINYSNTGVETVTACDSFSWWNTNYTNSTNEATHTLTNAAGCDSVVTLNLTVNYSNTGVETVTACNGYVWHNVEYTSSTNTPTFTSTNIAGCDSVTTLHLTIENCSTTEITACDSYAWHGTTYTASGMYFDGTDTLVLTINYSNTGVETVTACDSFSWWNTNYTNSTNEATHTLTNAAGCDSVVTLNLTVNYSSTGIDEQTACDRYTWIDGNTYTASNSTAQQTLTNALGCDSVVTLNLTVNYSNTGIDQQTACDGFTWIDGNSYITSNSTAQQTLTNAAGCDSVVTLNLTLYFSNNGIDEQTACDSYTWHGNNYTASTTEPTYTSTNAAGCDSVTTLNLTVNYSNTGVETVTACNGYVWHDEEYTSSTNTPTFTSTNVAGCDSVTTLHLTIENCSTTEITACDSYAWHGTTYTTSGMYFDGTDTLVLIINYSNTGVETVTACDSFTWWNTNYTNSTNEPTHTFVNVAGCDSVVTLNLTVNYSNTGVETVTACDSYIWHGTEYTASNNTATYTTTNAAGCDSVVTLNLTINNSSSATETITACDSYTWHGTEYTTSNNTATFTTTNAAGCDSVVTLNLTVNYSNTGIETITACDSYDWNGNSLTESGEYTYTTTNAAGCDSTVTLILTVNYSVSTFDTLTISNDLLPYEYNGITINGTGDYTLVLRTLEGCDSTVMLYVRVTTTGIDDLSSTNDISIYPNPTNGMVTIVADKVLHVDVLDIVGRKVSAYDDTLTIDLSNLPDGSYILRITTPHGTAVRKVTKK